MSRPWRVWIASLLVDGEARRLAKQDRQETIVSVVSTNHLNEWCSACNGSSVGVNGETACMYCFSESEATNE